MKHIKIDPEKINLLIANCGTKKVLSESIGREGSYIGHCMARGTISYGDYMLIKKTYDVDIQLKEDVPKIKSAEQMCMSFAPAINKDNIKSIAYTVSLINHIDDVQSYVKNTTGGLNKTEIKQFIELCDKVLEFVVEGVE